MLGGGGGLCGTAADYLRFAQMLPNKGELDGVRILGSRTVDYMTRNHLPATPTSRIRPAAVRRDDVRRRRIRTRLLGGPRRRGESCAVERGLVLVGGAASTTFWNDPAERITVLFLTQLLPSSTYPIRPQLQQLVYQALVD